MTTPPDDPKKPSDPSRSEEQESSEGDRPTGGETMAEVRPRASSTGLFREVLVQAFAGSPHEGTVQRVGMMLDEHLATVEPPAAELILARRLEAVTADLVFLATYLAVEVDTRRGNAVDPEDWEIARAAGHAGAQLLVLQESLLGEVELGPERTAQPTQLDDFLGCRETALWKVTDAEDAGSLRKAGAMLAVYAREVHSSEADLPESTATTTASAATADLLHLAHFALETAELAPADGAERLHKLSRYLTAAAQKLVEAQRGGPDLGDLLE